MFSESAVGKGLDKFDRCKIRLDNIMNGTESLGTINNDTIDEWLYNGKVWGMNDEFARTSRDSFITVTTRGMYC